MLILSKFFSVLAITKHFKAIMLYDNGDFEIDY